MSFFLTSNFFFFQNESASIVPTALYDVTALILQRNLIQIQDIYSYVKFFLPPMH